MDKQKEKALVAEAETFLNQLIENNKITILQIQTLIKKLQKVTSPNNKKIEESKKDLSEFVKDKNEIKEFLEKDDTNYLILSKAAQKVTSKSQPPQENPDKAEPKKTQSVYKFLKKDLIEAFNKEGENYFKDNLDNLFVYFENLSKDKLCLNNVPLFTMTYFPKEKKINVYLKCNKKMDLTFSQVDYLCNTAKAIFLNIDYYSLMENCEIEKSREYKGNSIDMAKFEKIIKENPIIKGNEISIIFVGNDFEKYKKEFKDYCEGLKDKIKSVATNNKDFFNEIVI